MPSGPPELHEYWSDKDPDYYADHNANRFLESKGYILTEEWEWLRPSLTHQPSDEEYSAINYLMWEWDYGGIADYGN